mgnify:CR=1 FL=1
MMMAMMMMMIMSMRYDMTRFDAMMRFRLMNVNRC